MEWSRFWAFELPRTETCGPCRSRRPCPCQVLHAVLWRTWRSPAKIKLVGKEKCQNMQETAWMSSSKSVNIAYVLHGVADGALGAETLGEIVCLKQRENRIANWK